MSTANHQMSQPLGLFAGELFDRGIQYLDAAIQLDYISNRNSLLPGSFLINHSLELIMKSYLVANDVDKMQIREKYSHYLQKIHSACLRRGLPAVENLGNLVNNLSVMNKDHDFRYPMGHKLTVIEPRAAIVVVQALANTISPFIERARIDSSLQFAADTRHLRGTKIEWSD